MEAVSGLYERAVAQELSPIWHLDESLTFFVGPLQYNRLHQHGAPVFLAGIYGSFGLRIHGGDWLSCRTAVIPAGVLHELDLGNEPLAVFYIEPSIDGISALMPLMGNTRELHGAMIGSTGEYAIMRELWEDGASMSWIGQALQELLAFSRKRTRTCIDGRISAAVAHLQRNSDHIASVSYLARHASLSESRFQHLFTREVGIPFRRYRAWCRIRSAISEVVKGSNFTSAAHTAGFADQAHFTHDFRRTFGAPPSISLLNLRTE